MSPVSAAARAYRVSFPPLPYPEDALEPVISAQTLALHYGKHHRKYVDTANELLEKAGLAAASLEEVVRTAKGKLFDNAGQAWNHDFYWRSLSPRGERPSSSMLRRIQKDFGNYERFADTLAAAASGQFGSGWAWLVEHEGRLQALATPNAESPMARGIRCLLAIDVWEHAYYVDYRNERDRYVAALIGERLNWQFAEANLAAQK